MENISKVTDFERKHFDQSKTHISNRIDTGPILGFTLTDSEIIALAGAPTESTVDVIYRPDTVFEGSEEVPAGLYFYTRNSKYIRGQNKIGIYEDEGLGLGIYINSIDFRSGGPKGLAARMLAVIVRVALRIPNITRMSLFAAGGRSWPDLNSLTGERWGGFVAWPTYGFDMLLERRTLSIARHFPYFPDDINSRIRVSDVLKIPGGREYWKIVGDGSYMDFDLSSEASASMKILDSFLGKVEI